MKYLLALSSLLCLIALFPHPKYRLTCLYLMATIPATLAFHTQTPWIQSWYVLLAGPVCVLRLVGGLEIAHRQTEGFRYWWRLMGSVFLVAGLFGAMFWELHTPHANLILSFKELRRLSHVWLGAMFVTLEAFWLSQGGALYRRADRAAVAFGFLALNHAVVGVISAVTVWDESTWPVGFFVSWGVDAVCYLWMIRIFSRGPDGLKDH